MKATVYSYAEYERWAQGYTRAVEDQARVEATKRCGGEVSDPMYAGDCPRCGWPHGRKGFLRADCLPGEWGFGKLFACPDCWPAPLGERQGPCLLSDGDREQLDLCRTRLAMAGKPARPRRGEAWTTVTATRREAHDRQDIQG